MNGDNSEKQIERLFDKFDDLAKRLAVIETKQDSAKDDLTQLKNDTRAIRDNGCSKAGQHADHETRIRQMEMSGRQGMALAGLGGTGIGGAVLALVQWLVGR